jgi:hypothetical protein
MRAFVTILLIVAISSFVIGNELACPDGCTNELEGLTIRHTMDRYKTCVLCHGGFGFDNCSIELQPGPGVRQAIPFARYTPLFELPSYIDHPPRLS